MFVLAKKKKCGSQTDPSLPQVALGHSIQHSNGKQTRTDLFSIPLRKTWVPWVWVCLWLPWVWTGRVGFTFDLIIFLGLELDFKSHCPHSSFSSSSRILDFGGKNQAKQREQVVPCGRSQITCVHLMRWWPHGILTIAKCLDPAFKGRCSTIDFRWLQISVHVAT